MRKTNLFLLSGLLLAGASAVALTTAPKSDTKAPEQAETTPAFKATMADKVVPVSSPRRAAEGEALPLPLTLTPTAEEFDLCSVADVNDDFSTWKYSADKDGSFHYKYNSNNDANDWLFLPLVHMEAGKISIKYTVYTQGNYPEQYKVYLMNGTDPSDVVAEIYDSGAVMETAGKKMSLEYDLATAGDYRVAFYCYSTANQYNLYINRVTIAEINTKTPKMPTINAIDFNGLDGTISVQAPTLNIGDAAIPGNVDLNVAVDGDAVEGSPFSCAPGEVKNIPLTLTKGNHTVTASATFIDNGKELTSDIAEETFTVTRLYPVPMPLPATIMPDEADGMHTIFIDGNNDSNTLKFETNRTFAGRTLDCYFYGWNSYNADDWMILPAMTTSEAGSMKLRFNIATNTDKENITIYTASAPTVEAMEASEPIMTMTDFSTSNTWTTQEASFNRTAGEFYIGIHITSLKNHGNIAFSDIMVSYIDQRLPMSPEITTNFDGSDGTVSVTLPSNSINGSAINAATVNAVLKIDSGDPIVLSGAPGQTVDYATSLAKGMHTASAYAYYNIGEATLTGEPTAIEFQIQRKSDFIYSLPLSIPMSKEDFEDMLVIDSNNDSSKWSWDNSMKAAKYNYNKNNPGDDWLITKYPVSITDAMKLYNVFIDGKSSSSYPEKFKICIGNAPTPEALTQTILDVPELKKGEFTTLSSEFRVSEAGNYYIGIYCYSDPDKLSLYVKNLKIEEAPNQTVPDVVTELTLTPDPEGLNSATLSFNMPANDIAHNALPADQQLTATVVSPTETKTITGTPGQAMNVTIGCEAGEQEFSVAVANADGTGQPVKISGYCGLDIPLAPEFKTITLTEDGYGLTLTWDAVTEGVHGGAINAPAMKYILSECEAGMYDWWEVAQVSETSYEYRVAEGTPQSMHSLSLKATNGENNFSSRSDIKEVSCGKPYEPEMDEQFAGNEYTYTPVYSVSTSLFAPSWKLALPGNYVTDAALADDQKVLVGSSDIVANSGLVLPLISTENAESASFSIETYIGSRTPDMEIYVSTYGSERISIGTIDASGEQGWQTFSFPIPAEMLNRPWIEVMVYCNFASSYLHPLIKSYAVNAEIINGVESVSRGDMKVFTTADAIRIIGAEGSAVAVSDLSGKRIFAGEGTADMRIATAKGIHIVTIDGKAYKLMVR